MCNFQHNKAVNMNSNEQPDLIKTNKEANKQTILSISGATILLGNDVGINITVLCPIVHLCLVSEHFFRPQRANKFTFHF